MASNTYEYAFDPISNRVSSTNDLTGCRTYLSAELNTYTNIVTQPACTNVLAYDLDGNMLTNGTWRYSYDAENRLIQAADSQSGENVFYYYDALGRRVLRRSSVQGERWYSWNGFNIIQDTDNWGSHISPIGLYSGSNVNSYVWGPDLSGTMQGAGGVGGLLGASFATYDVYDYDYSNGYVHCDFAYADPYYYAADANGNVTELIDTNGSVAAHYTYSVFGETTSATGTVASINPFRFSTKYHDDETGLVYYIGRYYHPDLGRWVNRDPIEESGGLNLYAFVGNDGVGRWDYLGMFMESHDCDEDKLGELRKAEKEAERRLDLWIGFFDGITSDGDAWLIAYFRTKTEGGINEHEVRKLRGFSGNLLVKLRELKNGFSGNAYGVECECKCSTVEDEFGEKQETIAEVWQNWVKWGWDNDIHICPEFFKLDDDEQAVFFLHEMSHFFIETKDDYKVDVLTANKQESLYLAQLYEDLARHAKDDRQKLGDHFKRLLFQSETNRRGPPR